jgi:superfamily II DNA or RNA helicase
MFRAGYRRVLYVLPTGGGKTTVAASIIRQAEQRGSTILFLAHRKELIDQASERLTGLGVRHGVIMADDHRARAASVQVGSIQTIARRGLPWMPNLVIVDECHRIKGEQYQRTLDGMRDALVIGITATPIRADGRGLRPPFETMVTGPSMAELRDSGYLVPARTYARRKPNLSAVHTTAGDYQTDELEAAMNRPELVGDVVVEWRKHAEGRTTAVFAVGVKHSLALRDAFRAAGIVAEHLDGSTPKAERERLLAALATGRITVLTNCGVLSEGWDCPSVSAVSIVRPTQSMGLYLQMAGRALRPAAGKEDCVLLDHGGCVYRHGLVDCDRIWSLDGDYERRKAAKRIKDQADLVKVCPDCDRVAELSEERCACGYVFSKRSRGPKQVSGELELVTDAKPISDDEKRRKYEWWLTEQTTKRRKDGSPYSPAYAVVKFRAMYGHPPKRGWREEWAQKWQGAAV